MSRRARKLRLGRVFGVSAWASMVVLGLVRILGNLLQADREFFIKKLGLTAEAFASYIAAPAIPHTRYRSWTNLFNYMRPYYRTVRRLIGGGRPAAETA